MRANLVSTFDTQTTLTITSDNDTLGFWFANDQQQFGLLIYFAGDLTATAHPHYISKINSCSWP